MASTSALEFSNDGDARREIHPTGEALKRFDNLSYADGTKVVSKSPHLPVWLLKMRTHGAATNWSNLAFFFGFAFLNGITTAALARRRGRAVLPWFIYGAAAFVVAIPWLFFTKSKLRDGQAPPSGMILLALVAVCCAVALAGADFLSIQAQLPPSCDTYLGVTDLKNFVAESNAGKTGLEIITLTNINEVSRSASRLACSATAETNTATTAKIDYDFFIEGGKRLIVTHWQ